MINLETMKLAQSLSPSEREWCDRMAFALAASGNYDPGGAMREAVEIGISSRRALFGQPEGESEHPDAEFLRAAKVEMAKILSRDESEPEQPSSPKLADALGVVPRWDGPKPARPAPAPVGEEVPEAVSDAIRSLRAVASLSEHQKVLYRRADALESFWRTHAAQVAFDLRTMTAKYDNERVLRERDASTHTAQPAKVRMTEELERVLATAVHGAAAYMNAKMYGHAEEARLAIAAVRAQAAASAKVELGKVRAYFNTPSALRTVGDERAALAELDAAEGKSEGRG